MEIEKRPKTILEPMSTFLLILTGILTSLDTLFKLGIWNKLFRVIQNKPELFWLKFGLIYFGIIFVTLSISWFWRLQFINRIIDSFQKRKVYFLIQMVCSIIIFAISSMSILWLFSYDKSGTREADVLFPQATQFGPTLIRTYASNGEAYYSFYNDTPIKGPEGYVKISLQAYGYTVEQNAGWVIFLLRGVDISNYKQLRFLIRGEKGGETIGIKAKDARGVEVSLIIDSNYLTEDKITTEWQQVALPPV